jgi:hypothetical protein
MCQANAIDLIKNSDHWKTGGFHGKSLKLIFLGVTHQAIMQGLLKTAKISLAFSNG